MKKEKHRQPTMKHHLIVLLICKQKALISIGTSYCYANLCTTICNTNTCKIWCLRLKLIRRWSNYEFSIRCQCDHLRYRYEISYPLTSLLNILWDPENMYGNTPSKNMLFYEGFFCKCKNKRMVAAWNLNRI